MRNQLRRQYWAKVGFGTRIYSIKEPQVFGIVSRTRICKINQFRSTFTLPDHHGKRDKAKLWGIRGKKEKCRRLTVAPVSTMFFHVVHKFALLITTFSTLHTIRRQIPLSRQGSRYRVKLNLGEQKWFMKIIIF